MLIALPTSISNDGVPFGALHGEKSQAARTRILKLFKEKDNAVLVATDPVARIQVKNKEGLGK